MNIYVHWFMCVSVSLYLLCTIDFGLEIVNRTPAYFVNIFDQNFNHIYHMNKCAYNICLIKVNAINRIRRYRHTVDISMQIANPNSNHLSLNTCVQVSGCAKN